MLIKLNHQYSFAAEDTSPVQDGAIAGAGGPGSRHSEHGLTCLAWNECVFEPAKIAVGGYSRRATVWTFEATESGSGKWREVSHYTYS